MGHNTARSGCLSYWARILVEMFISIGATDGAPLPVLVRLLADAVERVSFAEQRGQLG